MSWPLVQLGDVADISAGNSAPQGQDDFSEEGTPFVRAGSLSDLLKGATSHLERIAKGDAKRLKLRLFPKDSILFAKSGMSCMKGYVYRLPFEAHVVSHLAVVQPGPDLFPVWRDNLCEKSATIRMRVVVVAAGSGWPHGDQRSSGFAS